MKLGKNGKNYQRSKDNFVETNKLDRQTRIQLGRSPSWTSPAPDSVRRTAVLDQTGTRLHLELVTPLPSLHQTHSCFVSIGGIVGTLLFKKLQELVFSLRIFGLIV